MQDFPAAPENPLGMVLLPPIHVHSPVAPSSGSNIHRSFRYPVVPVASAPSPPKSQKCPDASVQLTSDDRPPGMFVDEAVPRAPYTPGCAGSLNGLVLDGTVLLPLIQVQFPAAPFAPGVYSHRSFK